MNEHSTDRAYFEFQMGDTRGKGERCVPSAAVAAARNTMLLLAAAAFLGWLVMWAVFPTRTYSSKWAPKLATLTGAGKQGDLSIVCLSRRLV